MIGLAALLPIGLASAAHAAPATVPAVSIADAIVVEGGPGDVVVKVRVELSSAAAGTVVVGFATSDGSAAAGSDYVAATGRVRFRAGQTWRVVKVTVHGDGAPEPHEHFTVTLSGPRGATMGDGTAAATVVDDDALLVGTDPEGPDERATVVGASLTKDAADRAGVDEPGGLFDPKYPATALNGGTLSAWVLEAGERWGAWDDYELGNDRPGIVWFQVLLHQDEMGYTDAELAAFADEVVAQIRARLPEATIYASPHPEYAPGSNCATTDDLVARTRTVVDHLVATHAGVEAGPVLPEVPPEHVQTTSCHLLTEGRAAQGEVLNAFFGVTGRSLDVEG